MNIGRGRAALKARLRFPGFGRIFADACCAGRFDWRLSRRRDLEIGELWFCDTPVGLARALPPASRDERGAPAARSKEFVLDSL